MKLFVAGALLGLASAAWSQSDTAIVLYNQDFETPTGFVNDGGDVNIFRTVNQLYGNQPPGFTFAQANTVETLRVGGSQAWGTGFLDPQARAGSFVLGMLSSFQNDLLGLSFNVGSNAFLNFRLDVSSIDLDRWSGPFVPTGGAAPVFRFSLYDNPAGRTGLGAGTPLSFAEVSGTVAPGKNTFDWTNAVVGLSTEGSTNGNVTLRIDLLSGGYAALDNFVIAASNIAGEVPPPVAAIPEPGTWALMLAGLSVLAGLSKRKRSSS